MKVVLFSLILGVAGMANAGSIPTAPSAAGLFASTGSTTALTFEAANRKGSKRVGGSGRSGKGGRYVGGYK